MKIGGMLLRLQEESERDLGTRAYRMVSKSPPRDLGQPAQSVQFLRGALSRSGMALSAFYFFLGAQYAHADASISHDHGLAVAATYTDFSALNSLTLSCRKIFDHSPSGLTGAAFAKTSPAVVEQHAEYWARKSELSVEEAKSALLFLQTVFRHGARQVSTLLVDESPFQRRIGLLKKHASTTAAHLSLGEYEIDLTDLAHVAAGLCVIGEIIRRFDMPRASANYFDEIESGSYEAAGRLFPMLAAPTLFRSESIGYHASYCLSSPTDEAVEYLERRLPAVIGWV